MSSYPLLQPYTPTSSDPFDAVKAAHLLNRAGFGGTVAEVEHTRSLGPQASLDELLDFPDAPAEEQSETDVPDLSAIDGVPKTLRALALQIATASDADKKTLRQKFNMANQQVMLAMGAWWMKHMAYGPHALQEKLTLFWHGHFTTSAKDEHMAELMWQQNEMLREYAAGNFATMVHSISRDPAMLDYLNNTQNKKAHANENYARELMELFTLGIGNYTENDVKQGARAFTGWSHDGEKFLFQPNQHDYGVKSYLNYVGDFNGDDVVDIILRNPACAPFIAGEMYRFFVSEDLDPKLQAALGAELRGADYELRPFLRTLLASKAFYSSSVVGAQIKSPVQLLAGSIRMLGLDLPDERVIQQQLTQMGQVPFQPPNVRGWVGGRNWINTGTIFVRYNAGVTLTNGAMPSLRNESLDGSAEEVVDRWVARLIQRPIDPDQRQILVDATGDGPVRLQTLKKIVQLIVSMPEYQLC